ncbi:hypothetical protein N7494_013190 [Penicillium frequentans]|uniref:Uncharacterized protein n=1 Tax=Penicillium frequentans TaxID=3151616 RepID=A0AAD6CI93_9EURO|nr:hypothetical protein N7494_013190 [Penicillium glabrum]
MFPLPSSDATVDDWKVFLSHRLFRLKERDIGHASWLEANSAVVSEIIRAATIVWPSSVPDTSLSQRASDSKMLRVNEIEDSFPFYLTTLFESTISCRCARSVSQAFY